MIYVSNHNENCCKYVGSINYPFSSLRATIFACNSFIYDYVGVVPGQWPFGFDKRNLYRWAARDERYDWYVFYNSLMDLVNELS